MKKAFRLILAAALCGLAFSSCTQDINVDDPVLSSAKGTRIIKASFAPTTRTELDGLQPTFKEGDEILVANYDEGVSEVCQIIGSGENAYFSTTIEGDLNAFYPAACAQYNVGEGGGNYFIPENQTGKFEDANICKAIISEGSSIATFSNATALFKVTPPEGTKQFTVRSLKPIGEDGQRSGTAKRINWPKGGGTDTLCTTVGDGTEALGTFYVSMLEGVNLSDLSFDTGSAMKGIPEKDIKAQAVVQNKTYAEMNAIKRGTAYDIDEHNWHPYVGIQMTIYVTETRTYKWSTMNLGANGEIEAGTYFSWGDIIGQKPSGNTFSTSFNWTTAPFNNKKDYCDKLYFNTIKDTECPNGVLALKNDAAYMNWGGAWRMPTYEEFESLISSTSTSKEDYTSGVLTIKGTNLKFPAAGGGYEKDLRYFGEEGRYYTSSLLYDDPAFAWQYFFRTGDVSKFTHYRDGAIQIRPIFE